MNERVEKKPNQDEVLGELVLEALKAKGAVVVSSDIDQERLERTLGKVTFKAVSEVREEMGFGRLTINVDTIVEGILNSL